MIPEKEKKKLVIILSKSQEIESFSEANFERTNGLFKEYAAIIRKLYWKEPNIFGNFYKYDLVDIKNKYKVTNEIAYADAKPDNFLYYKAQLEQSIMSAIEYITHYVLQE